MDDIQELRNRIDKIDKELVALFEERMAVSLEIGKYKRERNLPIYDENRERAVIEKNKARLKNKEFEEPLEKLYKNLMKSSKDAQEKLPDNL